MPRSPVPARLIAPYALKRFLAEDWGERPLLVRGSPRKFSKLFGWPALNDLLATRRLQPPLLRLAYSGDASIDLESFIEYRALREERSTPRLQVRRLNGLLARGATLVLNEAQTLHAPLAALTRAFGQLFVGEPNINLYASFGRQAGFGPHWDAHDVFVLQISGEKRWLLYGPNRRHPLHRDVRSNEMQPVRAVARHRLKAGDLLYIPRGHWHDAIGTGEPTLHLTLGIRTLTAIDYVNWLSDDLRAVEGMREDIPLFDSNKRERWIAALQKAVTLRTQGSAYERFIDERRAHFHPSTRPALPHSVDGSAPSRSDRLRWTGMDSTALPDRSGLSVRSGGHEYRFDHAAGPLIDTLLTGRAVTFGALLRRFSGTLGRVRVHRFIAELLREHFVTIMPRD